MIRQFVSQYWMEFVFLAVTGILSWRLNVMKCKVHKTTQEFEALKLGMQSMLRDRIIQAYNKYIEQKWIPIYAMDSIQKLFDAYVGLGGNGTIHDLVEELKDLPKHPPDGSADPKTI